MESQKLFPINWESSKIPPVDLKLPFAHPNLVDKLFMQAGGKIDSSLTGFYGPLYTSLAHPEGNVLDIALLFGYFCCCKLTSQRVLTSLEQ